MSKIKIYVPSCNWLTASAILLTCASTYAVESSYSIFSEVEHSDNINRVVDNEESDVEASIGGNLRLYSNTGGDFRYDANYGARYVNYRDDSFDDELEITGSALVEYFFVPEFFSWNLIHRQTRTSSSSRSSDTPDDIERRTTWQTGPSFYWNPTAVDVVGLSGIYSQTNFETTDNADTERAIVDLSWSHRLSPITSVRTFVQGGQVEFDNANNDYEFARYGIGFARELSSWQWDLDLGGNTVFRDETSNVDGFFLRGAINYQEGRSSFTLRASQEVTDSSIGLGLNSSIGDTSSSGGSDVNNDLQVDSGSSDTNFNVQDIVERTRFDIVYRYDFLRSDFVFNTFWDMEDFEEFDDDQTFYGFGASWEFDLNTRSSLVFDANVSERDFDSPVSFSRQRNVTAGIGYRYRISDHWSLSSRVSQNRLTREDAGDALANITPIDETRFLFRVSYDIE